MGQDSTPARPRPATPDPAMPPHPEPEILFDGEDMQLRHYRGTSDFRLLTFDIMHARAGRRGAFGVPLTARLGIDHLAVVPKYPCWYPRREAETVALRIAALKDRPTIAYGASMGGYGALKWGGLAGADCAIACSPRATIDPATLGRHDRRYAAHFRADLHGGMQVRAADLPPHAVALHDPREGRDRFQVGLMAGIATLHPVAAPFTAHATAQCVAGSANAVAIFRAALAHDTAAIRRRVAQRRRGLAARRLFLALACGASGRQDAALAILDTIRNAMPRDYLMALAQILTAQGRPAEAARFYRAVLEGRPRDPGASRHLARLAASAAAEGGADDGAARLLGRLVGREGIEPPANAV